MQQSAAGPAARRLQRVCRSKKTIRSGDLRVLVGSGGVRVFVDQAAQDGLRWIRVVSRSVTVTRGVSRSASGTC